MQRPKPQCIDVRGDTPYPCMGWYQTLGKSPPLYGTTYNVRRGTPSPLYGMASRGETPSDERITFPDGHIWN